MYQEINDFVQNYGNDIYRFCYYLTKNKAEAEDLYQETFLTAVEKKDVLLKILQAGTGEQEAARSARKYLMAIVANLWKNKWRKQVRHDRIAPVDDREEAVLEAVSCAGDPEANYLQKELYREVRKLIDGLPEKMRIVIYLYYIVQMSTKEIAESLHVPVTTVRSRLSKARKQLRKELEERDYGRY